MDQRLEVAAHVHVGRRFLSLRVDLEAQRVLRPCINLILNITGKAQHLLLAAALHLHRHRHERRVIDLDTDLLHWRHQEVVITVTAHDGGEQANHRLASDGCAQVVPGTVPSDAHVDIATEVGVPQMHRWQPLVGLGNLRQQIVGLATLGHHPLLNDSCLKGYERNPQGVGRANLLACYRGTSAIRRGF
ncbi:hypothetical protein D3C81_923560 [compost metagenome]